MFIFSLPIVLSTIPFVPDHFLGTCALDSPCAKYIDCINYRRLLQKTIDRYLHDEIDYEEFRRIIDESVSQNSCEGISHAL